MRPQRLVIVAIATLALFGCKKNQEPTAQSDLKPYEATAAESPTYQPLTRMDTTSDPYASDPYASDPYASDRLVPPPTTDTTRITPPTRTASDTTTTRAPAKTTTIIPATPAGPRTHTIKKGDTLYSLARQYYGAQGKWKDIWEANRSTVPDPNKLMVGTKIVIP